MRILNDNALKLIAGGVFLDVVNSEGSLAGITEVGKGIDMRGLIEGMQAKGYRFAGKADFQG